MKKHNRSIIFYGKRWLFIVGILWTGLFLAAGIKQYAATGHLEKKLASALLERGLSAKGIQYSQNTAGARSDLWYHFFAEFPALRMLWEMEEAQQEEAALAGIGSYPDTNQQWSSAAGKKFRETQLLQSEQENSQEKTEQEDSLPVQNIVLFHNGSGDITSENRKNDAGDARKGGKVACDSIEQLKGNLSMLDKLEKSNSRSYLLKKFYITDSSTSIDRGVFQVKELLKYENKERKETPDIDLPYPWRIGGVY